MLNGDVKKQINTARDILVGKIPDPKGQIDQITNALIYKFMDDQDRLSQTLPGGKASFFINNLGKYAWHKLFDSKLSNQDRANLYIEGIAELSNAKHLPELFKDVFKDAFLPFRDANTIAMFLNEINKFDYHHSENLGNAFEYLLSIMGSQGDAGQFRTPRNIIEFIVDAVNPTKDDHILDPACGTAGFLVEAYKHIASGSKLTPNEVQGLAKHIHGVDIDPGMAKIARVNLYLHGFKTPLITEDDTLTNESLWGKKYDVILANPPFMTPKGGIVPHNKFSIRAKKAEILFVEYILEHLKLKGRAGIVIPDGIISNTPKLYKKLREKLIKDNFLYATVSLPAGIFLPYSDVKTTILFIDREIAQQSDQVLFIQVKNDGFDLGSARKIINQNDLPHALQTLSDFKESILSKKNFEIPLKDFDRANIVKKSEILNSSSVSLSGKRYKKEKFVLSKYRSVKLGTLVSEFKQKVKTEEIPVWSVSNTQGFVVSSEYFGKKVASEDIKNYKKVLKNYFAYNPARINVGSIALNDKKETGCVSPMYIVFKIKDETLIHPKYLLTILKSKIGLKQILKYSDGAVRKVLSFSNLSLIDVPLPLIEDQNEIIEHFNVINKYEEKIQQEKISIKDEIDLFWGIKEDEVVIDAEDFGINIETDGNEDVTEES